jgi:hypothetical protein
VKIQKEGANGKAHLIYKVLDENGLVRPESNWDLPPQ